MFFNLYPIWINVPIIHLSKLIVTGPWSANYTIEVTVRLCIVEFDLNLLKNKSKSFCRERAGNGKEKI
jgi:hypothetical protein